MWDSQGPKVLTAHICSAKIYPGAARIHVLYLQQTVRNVVENNQRNPTAKKTFHHQIFYKIFVYSVTPRELRQQQLCRYPFKKTMYP